MLQQVLQLPVFIQPTLCLQTFSLVFPLHSLLLHNPKIRTRVLPLISLINLVMLRSRGQGVTERKRLFLGVGDEVTHLRYEEWGIGVVVEVMTSSVPGGTCLARIRFQDGQLRCFSNDLDNESCCYYFGVRRYWNPSHGVNAIRSRFFLRG